MNKKMFVLFLAVVVILLVGGVVWYGGDNKETPKPTNESEVVTGGEGENKEEKEEKTPSHPQPKYDFSKDLDVNMWATYESEKVGVRIKYPRNWEILNFEDPKSDIVLRSPNIDAHVYAISVGLIPNKKT